MRIVIICRCAWPQAKSLMDITDLKPTLMRWLFSYWRLLFYLHACNLDVCRIGAEEFQKNIAIRPGWPSATVLNWPDRPCLGLIRGRVHPIPLLFGPP